MSQVLDTNAKTDSKLLKAFQCTKINCFDVFVLTILSRGRVRAVVSGGRCFQLSAITSLQLKRQFANNNFNASQIYICNAE